jgi:hypothetical protein
VILCTALGAGAFYKPVGQKHLIVIAVELLDCPRRNMPLSLGGFKNFIHESSIAFRVRRPIVIMFDFEAFEISNMLFSNLCNHGFWRNVLFASGKHYRSSVRVVCTDEHRIVASHLLESILKINN